nr:tigger transposable element-derived protein 6-like [Parasteatoda tepidariorum]
MDECGLFFNLLPDKTFAFKGEPCHGGKNSKERLTILVGASMNGIEKLPILVIGKSKKPRCFRNVKSLPCDYDSNQKSWMTIKIFETYLKKLDSKMRKEKRNIIIFVDNCAAHSKENKYTNIKLQFLPPNSTSVLQPMDQGVIKVFKQHYKMRLVKRMLEGLENTEELKKTWESITPSAIANCFQKARFSDGDTTEEYDFEAEYKLSDDETNENFDNDWKSPQNKLNFTASFKEYVSVDDEILPCDVLTLEDICEVKNGTEELSEAEENVTKLSSFSEARKGVDTSRKFIYSIENVPSEMFKYLQKLDNFQLQ